MEGASNIESEVNSWLQVILKKENLSNLSVNVLGNTEKGDGYIGDIVFVDATGTIESGSTKKYNLVLKCSKRSQVLREQSMSKEAFLNEIYMFETLMPAFTRFQLSKGVEDYFNSMPKCYGAYIGDNMEVIALDNLKELGYVLWEKKKPLPRSHINKVVEEYGKFHAVSIAMQHQQPETFQQFKEHFEIIDEKCRKKNDPRRLFSDSIEEIYDLLKDELEESVMKKWRSFKQDVDSIFGDMLGKADVKVISHGDCWNNNFMYYYDETDNKTPMKVAILDWQVSRFVTPIVDLSYFIFACISQDDLEDMESVLGNYHTSLSQHMRKLGTDPESAYPFHQLLEDWKNFCKFGVLVITLVHKICSTEKDEVIDIGEAAEQGVDFNHSFMHEIRDKDNFKNRIKPIIQYAVKEDLI